LQSIADLRLGFQQGPSAAIRIWTIGWLSLDQHAFYAIYPANQERLDSVMKRSSSPS
jgi:hypothetical protein